jgi:hypothetical protein
VLQRNPKVIDGKSANSFPVVVQRIEVSLGWAYANRNTKKLSRIFRLRPRRPAGHITPCRNQSMLIALINREDDSDNNTGKKIAVYLGIPADRYYRKKNNTGKLGFKRGIFGKYALCLKYSCFFTMFTLSPPNCPNQVMIKTEPLSNPINWDMIILIGWYLFLATITATTYILNRRKK